MASLNSISFATVTPSFVITGPPKDFPITTFLPFGPSVIFTAFASSSIPCFKRSRASILNFISFYSLNIFIIHISTSHHYDIAATWVVLYTFFLQISLYLNIFSKIVNFKQKSLSN